MSDVFWLGVYGLACAAVGWVGRARVDVPPGAESVLFKRKLRQVWRAMRRPI